MTAGRNFAFKIAAKSLQMVTIDRLTVYGNWSVVIALSNATVDNLLRRIGYCLGLATTHALQTDDKQADDIIIDRS